MQVKQPQISSLYRKILYTKDIAPITIKFTKSGTLYDSLICNIENPYLNFIPYSFSDNCIDAQLLFINDPIHLINHNEEFNKNILNKVLFFHDDKILRMKKEDLFLFKQQIVKYTKYTFDKKICSVLNDAIPIQYGFKQSGSVLNKREKSIIFVGNNQNIDLVAYNHIRQMYPDSDFISADSNTDISNLLVNYKICISMSSIYNNLLAASSGCLVISSMDNEQNIPYYQKVNNFDDLLNAISYILKSYNDQIHKQISESITKQYDYTKFINNINHITKNMCNRAIIL